MPAVRRLVLPLATLALALTACGGSSGSDLGTVSAPSGGGATAGTVSCTDPTPPANPPAALSSPPTVTAGTATPPATTQVTTLVKGNGPVVKAGDCVIVNYVGANYADGKVFDASSRHGSAYEFVAGGSGAIEGFSKGVIGVPVGSRVKLVIPAAEGYGAQGQGPIGPNETLIFIVDVLRIKTA